VTTATGLHVAYPELRRNAREVLRGAGLPLPLANEAAEALAWTEAALGGAIAFLGTAAEPDDPHATIADDGAGAVVACGGASLLALGGRIAEYAVALASEHDVGRVAIRDTCGAGFLPFVTREIATHGLAVVARAAAANGPAYLAVAGEAAAPDYKTVARGAGVAATLAVTGGEDAWRPEPCEVELACGRKPLAALEGELAADPLDDATADPDCERRVERAIADGLTISAEDRQTLAAFVGRLRVPSSERSRSQAG
jgi:hypothetical protein